MKDENQMKIGCCITLEQVPLAEASGFDFFALPGGWLASLSEETFCQLCDARAKWQIPCLSLNAAIAPATSICGPGFDDAEARDYGQVLCRRAAELGVKMIGVGSPNSRRTYGTGDFRREWQDTCQFLRILAAEGRPYGIQIGWEPLNVLETSFGIDWAESWAKVRTLREEGVDNLGMVLDLYHLLLQPFPVEDVLESSPWICQVHLAWPDGRKQRRYPQAEDMPHLLALLEQLRTTGWHSDLATEVFTGDLAAAGKLLQTALTE